MKKRVRPLSPELALDWRLRKAAKIHEQRIGRRFASLRRMINDTLKYERCARMIYTIRFLKKHPTLRIIDSKILSEIFPQDVVESDWHDWGINLRIAQPVGRLISLQQKIGARQGKYGQVCNKYRINSTEYTRWSDKRCKFGTRRQTAKLPQYYRSQRAFYRQPPANIPDFGGI